MITRNKRQTISTKAKAGFLSPKNKKDHNPFSNSCSPKNCKAFTTSGLSVPDCQIRPAEIPIKVYRSVQTGPNSQLGGLKKGFSKVTYHSEIAGNVTVLAASPTALQISIPIRSFAQKGIFMKLNFIQITYMDEIEFLKEIKIRIALLHRHKNQAGC